MAGRRIVYLTALVFCGVFYIAYGQWLSFLILTAVAALPWFSLLLSLPAMLRFHVAPSGPSLLTQGDTGELWLMGSCPYPMPPFRGKLRLRRLISGESWYYQDPDDLPANHCGGIRVTAESVKICDYLGLFSFPVRARDAKTIRIRPQPLKMDLEHDIRRYIAQSWKPKFGGGYAENHELRLYRPGDSLNQVHWKLSAKTGGLILREPMEPQRGLVLLTINLRGNDDEIDRKLGRFLWLGSTLLEQGVRFELRALTGDGLLTFSIGNESEHLRALDALLCSSAVKEGDLRRQEFSASWHCHIGGQAHEA